MLLTEVGSLPLIGTDLARNDEVNNRRLTPKAVYMPSILLLFFCLLSSSAGHAVVDVTADAHSPKRSEIKPGTVIIRKTVFGFSISNAVLKIEGHRALVRVSVPESIRFEWIDLRDVAADRSTFAIVPPSYNPYETVLIPIPKVDGQNVRRYEQHPVIHMVADDTGREMLMTPSGLLVEVGTRADGTTNDHDERRTHLHPNVPVEAGESPADAIHRYNETYGEIDGYEYLETDIRVFKVKSDFQIATARAQADRVAAQVKTCGAFR